MGNDIQKFDQPNIPSLAMSEKELMVVLESSLYPGAAQESIKMVIGYCKASGLDPMQKPVHIVPIWDGKAKRMRDVIMPGVGLYRTQAARSGNYAGVSEPEFGPDVQENIGGTLITYPAWCKVTVRRSMASGMIAEFSAIERWKENYAVKGGQEKSIAPNSMWAKRPYGQIAKCSEAQALRKAFPEAGSAPTADEMEGKPFDGEAIEGAVVSRAERPVLPSYDQESFDANFPKWCDLIARGKKSADDIIALIGTKAVLSDVQKEAIRDCAPMQDVPDDMPGQDFIPAGEVEGGAQ